MLKRLILRNNIALLTKGTKEVDLTFKDLVNIFMGRNGFGKTSILEECHILPPDNADYDKDGYKYAEWEVDNKTVITVESFTGTSSKHSFKINGKELNNSSTLTVQKDLCLKHTGITPQLIRYMTGIKHNDLLSNLSPMARRQLFMDMYPNDTSYALKVYNKIKDELRNVNGAIKNQYRRLAEEQSRATWLEEQTPEYLEQQIETLEQQIKDGMVLSGVLSACADSSDTIKTLKGKYIQLVRALVNDHLETVLTPREIEEELLTYEEVVNRSDFKLEWIRTKLKETMDILSAHNHTGESLEVVEDKLKTLKGIQNSQLEELTLLEESIAVNFSNYKEDELQTINQSSHTLIEHLNALTVASSTEMSLTQYSTLMTRYDELGKRGRYLKEKRQELAHLLKHYDNEAEVNCPECKHGFKPGFDVKEIELKRNELIQVNNAMTPLVEEYRKLELALENDKDYYESMTRLVNFIRISDDNSKTLVTLAKDKKVGYVDPSQLVNHLTQLQSFIKLKETVNKHQHQIDELTLRMSMLKRKDFKELTLEITELEYLMAEQFRIRNFNLEKVKSLKGLSEKVKIRELKLQQLELLQEEILDHYQTQGKFLVKEANNQALGEWVPTKDRYVQMLIRSKSLKSVIDSISSDIAYLEDRKEKLEVLMGSLCPNKGLLGELMGDFIKTVVSNINAIVREVFTTPLYLMSCKNKKGDLTYKFPVVNSNDRPPAKDLEDCSGGEQDMLNFAFRMILIRYKSPEFPLVLDEVGIKLDNFHQNKFFEYIARLSTAEQVKQILMVSHFMSHVGMFKGANIVALNSEGIDVPETANSGVVFK